MMKVPLKWLSEYVDVPWSVDEAVKRFTLSGLKVEGVSHEKIDVSGVVTAKVVSVSPHPARPALKVGVLDTGNETFTVVSGAPALQPGKIVLLAAPGSTLPGGLQLGTRNFAGVTSQGMVVCSNEILYGTEHREGEDIIVLPGGTPLGVRVQDLLQLDDHVIDIELTVNYSHCLSILGVALEVSALTGNPPKLPGALSAWDWAGTYGSRPPKEDMGSSHGIKVELPDPDLCPRYVAKIVRNVTQGYSPIEVERRLQLAGMRPVSAIVDATNYVMLETGQPLHAFDLDTIVGGVISARRSCQGETIVTLDGESHDLDEGTLVIADGEGPVAVGGVMGGGRTEVTGKTKNLLLESAYFAPIPVRKTSQRLRLRTEAAVRFEKGVDPTAQASVIERLAEVVTSHCGGEAKPGRADLNLLNVEPKTISITARDFQRTLGIPVPPEEGARVLTALRFGVERKGEALEVTVPPRRVDVDGTVDLIEEVARQYGYDAFEPELMSPALPGGPPNPEFVKLDSIRELLVRLGGHETVSTSFIDIPDVRVLGWGEKDPRGRLIPFQNPLAAGETHLRTSLLPNLLRTLKTNQNLKSPGGLYWETGTVFFDSPDELPLEARELALASYGVLEPATWTQEERKSSFFEMKGIVESLLELCGVKNVVFLPNAGMPFHPGKSARIVADGSTLGEIGEIHPLCQGRLDMTVACVLARFSLDSLLAVAKGTSHKQVSRFMPVERDLAVVVDESVSSGEVIATVRGAAQSLASVILFDVYRKPPVPEGKKSLAMRLTYQPSERTLTEEDLSEDRARIIARLEKEFSAKQRL